MHYYTSVVDHGLQEECMYRASEIAVVGATQQLIKGNRIETGTPSSSHHTKNAIQAIPLITLAFGTLAVLAQPGGPADIGAVATDAQKDTCFDQCNDQGIKESFQCYEKCLKNAIAGGPPQEPAPKVGKPVGTLEQRKTCFKQCEEKLISQGEDCYVKCLDNATGGAASGADAGGAGTDFFDNGMGPEIA